MRRSMINNGLEMKLASPFAGMRRSLTRAAASAAALLALGSQGARANTFAFAPIAGNANILSQTNGTGGAARFFNPTSVAVDSSGNVYVADGGDHTVRKITSGGSVTTLAGSSGQAGSTDGTGSGALFLYPYAVAVDTSGNVYVADSGNNNVRRITPAGNVETLAGNAGLTGSADGTGSAATFNQPQGITVDSSGNVYVSDTNNGTIRKVTQAGVVTTIAGEAGQTGSSDGSGSSARFNYPAGLGVDSSGNVYIADFDNDTVRMMTPGGAVTTIAGTAGVSGSANGQGTAAQFNHPLAVALDGSGNIYVIDTSNQTVREIAVGGSVSTLAGTAGIGGQANGSGAAAQFFYPAGIASTASGVLYVADTGNHLIRALASGSVSSLAGAAGSPGDANGTGSAALFDYPHGVATNGSGTVVIADAGNNLIRVSTAAGVVTTLAGIGGIAGSANGTGTAASFNAPAGVAIDASGNVYVADTGNSTIRKIAPGGAVTTLAGVAGQTGSSDGTGAAATFNQPQGVAVDSSGNVYVADTNNDTIRKITSGGTVTTLAGSAGQTGSGNGAGGSARFNHPYDVAVDSSGNVYVADFGNATIRMINTSNTVSTLAGTAGVTGFLDGSGFAAKFNQPYAVTVDGSGNVYVADTYNRAIREIAPGGAVTTLNGTECRFYYPQGIAATSSGTLFVADGDNQAISMGGQAVAPPSGAAVASETVTSGQSATFSVSVSDPTITFQWEMSTNSGSTWTSVSDNATFSGAQTDSLTVDDPTSAMSGEEFEVQLTNAAGTSTSAAATLTVSGSSGGGGSTSGSVRITNLSTRATVGTGSNILIPGLYISGSGTETLLIRGDGPALTQYGVSGVLAQPTLSVYDSAGTLVASNTGWGTNANPSQITSVSAQVGAFALAAGSADCALIVNLSAGSYTVQIAGVNNTTGVAIAEVYEVASSGSARLANLSTRATVGTGANILIPGFYVAGTGTEQLLVRADGPALTQYGVSGVLAQPTLSVYDSAGTLVASNTGWGTGPDASEIPGISSSVGAFALATGSADCALLVSLQTGSYTIQISGVGDTTGVALAEVYEVP
jgi:sugar lactone lactonase YvrE